MQYRYDRPYIKEDEYAPEPEPEILFEQVKKLNSFLITWQRCDQQMSMVQRQYKQGQPDAQPQIKDLMLENFVTAFFNKEKESLGMISNLSERAQSLDK